MYSLLRFFLFMLKPETAHKVVFFGLKLLQGIPFLMKWISNCNHYYDKPIELFGIHFPNRIGLAAGLDKDAEVFDALSTLGFGHIEIGTITPLPQLGNPQPRLFRLVQDKALINRMGFNNQGMEAAKLRLAKRKTNIIIGGNIGKNKNTSNEHAICDYEKVFLCLYPVVDYFVVNVSSPNTPNLRALQEKEPLKQLLSQLMTLNKKQERQKPILLKIAPDLSFEQIDDIISIVEFTGINGLIATNTTIEREPLTYNQKKVEAMGNGGLSGKPLTKRSTAIIRYISKKTKGTIPIIGVGGIFSKNDALEKLEAGASLIQLYTGFIYKGSKLVKQINKTLLDK